MFSQVCVKNSVHKGVCVSQHVLGRGVCVSQHALGRGCLPMGGCQPRGCKIPPGPEPDTPLETAAAAEGTHPTGKHSCLLFYL